MRPFAPGGQGANCLGDRYSIHRIVGLGVAIGLLAVVLVLFGGIESGVVPGIDGHEPPFEPTPEFTMGQRSERVYGNHSVSPDPHTDVLLLFYEGGGNLDRRNLNVHGSISLANYTSGEYDDTHARLIGIADADETPRTVTTPAYNTRDHHPLEEPELTKYGFWIASDADHVLETVDGSESGFRASTWRNLYRADRCHVRIAGQPRRSYAVMAPRHDPRPLGIAGQFSLYRGPEQGVGGDGECSSIERSASPTVDPGRDELDLDAMGQLQPGDVGRLIWSPPDVDASTQLAVYEIR